MSDGVPLQLHFDRVLHEETRRFQEVVANVRAEIATALDHHRELHAREHGWAEKLQEVFKEAVERAVQGHEVKFDIFVEESRSRYTDLRERSDGRDDRLRHDIARELNELREVVQREITRLTSDFARELKELKDTSASSVNQITGIKSRSAAYAVALTIFMTIITVGINLVGVLVG